jgi:putative redox protein
MIKCLSKESNFETFFTDDRHEGTIDAPADKGGGGAGFGPHELLEAALAGCLNITLRKYAASHNIPLAGATTWVSLNRQIPEETIFEYGLELQGPITAAQRQELIQAAAACAVHQTLSRKISFNCLSA